MSTPILSCRSADRVDAMLARMTIARVRHLPVIEENELKGIVSIGDLVKHPSMRRSWKRVFCSISRAYALELAPLSCNVVMDGIEAASRAE